MPFKNKEDYNAYMRAYRARKNANWHTNMNEPEKFQELEGYSELTPTPRIFDNFGEDKKGMQVVCSTCGTPLAKGHCPKCEYVPDF